MSAWSSTPLALSRDERAQLEAAIARRPRGLFTDIDGTISPIAPTPEAAVLLPSIHDLLVEACAVFDLVVAVSGRSALDARRLVSLPCLLYIGNHGMERLEPHAPAVEDAVRVQPDARRYADAIGAILTRVEPTLRAHFPGVQVERKGVTASIHFRNAADHAAAEAGILAALAETTAGAPVRLTRGKMVVELRPPIHADKGTTLTALVREARLAGALYLGDDRTDIDAFRALRRLRVDGVCVGAAIAVAQPEAPAELAAEADLVLPNIERVPALLAWLIERTRATDQP